MDCSLLDRNVNRLSTRNIKVMLIKVIFYLILFLNVIFEFNISCFQDSLSNISNALLLVGKIFSN